MFEKRIIYEVTEKIVYGVDLDKHFLNETYIAEIVDDTTNIDQHTHPSEMDHPKIGII